MARVAQILEGQNQGLCLQRTAAQPRSLLLQSGRLLPPLHGPVPPPAASPDPRYYHRWSFLLPPSYQLDSSVSAVLRPREACAFSHDGAGGSIRHASIVAARTYPRRVVHLRAGICTPGIAPITPNPCNSHTTTTTNATRLSRLF